MCGIVGYIGHRQAAPLILDSLRKLEYRGYDSAGIAVLNDGHVAMRRCEGKLGNLGEAMLDRQPMAGVIGIGHTRWATHGRPSETNAHPHRAGDVVVVHNGIIENYLELKEQLTKRGTHFSSETDSEIVAHLVAEKIERGMDFLEAVRRTLREIHGSYALLFLNRRDPKRLIVAKNSTPIVIGWGEGETFIASDIPALLDYTRKVTFLEDGEIGEVMLGSYRLLDGKGKTIHRPVKEITWDAVAARKDGYRPLHAQRNSRSAARLGGYFSRPHLAQGRPGGARRYSTQCRRGQANQAHSIWSPAARPGTPVWSANSCSKRSPAFPPKSTTVPSFATVRR